MNTGRRRIAERVLDLFPMLKEFLNRRGGNLSGGQQQLAFGRRASRHFAILNRSSVAVGGPIRLLTNEMIHQQLVV
jgi:urea transport system ATP-binding protein